MNLPSGNFNCTVLVKAMSRGGWSVTFTLHYNSRIWRQDEGGAWSLIGDVVYSFGWRLLAGSITPVDSETWMLGLHSLSSSASTLLATRSEAACGSAGRGCHRPARELTCPALFY